MIIGRERELDELNDIFHQGRFQLFVLYGRRRVGKTTLLNAFCQDKDAIFYAAEQSNDKLNLDKFSAQVFAFYGESGLEPFSSWENALLYIHERQQEKQLVLVFDEFPYLVKKNETILSTMQHLVDHKLQYGKLFIILCGSYMGFMEKEVLGSESPIFGRRTGQLHLKPFDYQTSMCFMEGFTDEERLMLYGAYGGTALYLQQIESGKSFEENIRASFLRRTSYLYEEPVLLLQQEVQEPGTYSAVIEAIAGGASKANEIATKTGEPQAKCLKYIKTLCELGILYKESPFQEKDSSRRTIYGISDLMFRFWYRYVFSNRTLVETGAQDAVWKRKIAPDYSHYMGLVFERVCREYLLRENSAGNLPVLFTDIGRWWGTDPASRQQEEIDLVASDGEQYLFGECKWRSGKLELSVLEELKRRAAIFRKDAGKSWFLLFSKEGFSEAVSEEAKRDERILLVDLCRLMDMA